MHFKTIMIVGLLLLGGCGRSDEDYPTYSQTDSQDVESLAPVPSDFPTEEELKAAEEATKREQAIADRIHNDKNLNWIRVGISTGKFTESISSGVYKTWKECQESYVSEDNTCIPVSGLPSSYWKTQE